MMPDGELGTSDLEALCANVELAPQPSTLRQQRNQGRVDVGCDLSLVERGLNTALTLRGMTDHCTVLSSKCHFAFGHKMAKPL